MDLNFENKQKKYDSLIKSDYNLVEVNAQELSSYLKKQLQGKNIELSDYNISKFSFNDEIPLEIYEYNNFVLLENKTGELILMDGFRRLLCFEVPDIKITVRVYNEEDLTNQEMLRLLIFQNHFKFYTNSKYYDRGFSLFFKLIFQLDIPKYHEVFNNYLTLNELSKNFMYRSNTVETDQVNIKDRLLNEFFIDDIKFIQDLYDNNIFMTNFFGSVLYTIRSKYPKNKLDSKFFIEKLKNDKIFNDLVVKIKNSGENRSDKSLKITNNLSETYEKVLRMMFGEETKKTYKELLNEVRTLVEETKKDGEFFKVTDSRSFREINEAISEKILKGEELKFKIFVFPKEKSIYSMYKSKDNFELKSGLFNGVIKYNGLKNNKKKKNIFHDADNYKMDFTIHDNEGNKFTLENNYTFSNYTSHLSNKWCFLERKSNSIGTDRYDVKVFINIDKKRVKYFKDNRVTIFHELVEKHKKDLEK
jgi:hypothetical protein